MKLLYGFMQDEKWYEDVGHVFIGMAPMLGWWREDRQLPPENDRHPVLYITKMGDGIRIAETDPPLDHGDYDEYWSEVRVRDVFRDNLGYAIGETIRTAVLVGVGTWLLLR